MGTGYIEILLDEQERSLEIVNMAETDTSDLIQDLVSVIYSFSAKLYGLRRSKRKTEKIIKYLTEENALENVKAKED